MNWAKRLSSSGLIWSWVTIVVMGVDRLSKYWVIHHLQFFEPVRITPFFNFTLAYNTGAAFSFLHSASGWQNIFLGGLALIISAIVFFWLSKLPSTAKWNSIALCLILGGALGNAWDRMLYRFVVDFLDFHLGDWHFAIFNIADAAISIGAFMLVVHWLFLEKKD